MKNLIEFSIHGDIYLFLDSLSEEEFAIVSAYVSPSTVHIFAAHLYLSFGCSIRLFHSSGVFDKALPLGS